MLEKFIKNRFVKTLLYVLLFIYIVWLTEKVLLKGKDLQYLIDHLLVFLFGADAGMQEAGSNLVLFDTIKLYANSGGILTFDNIVANVLGNIFAFAPIGLLLIIIENSRRKIIKVTIFGGIYSLFLETTQYLLKIGVFDVDDLFLNTFGVFIGGIVGVAFINKIRRQGTS